MLHVIIKVNTGEGMRGLEVYEKHTAGTVGNVKAAIKILERGTIEAVKYEKSKKRKGTG